MMIRAPALLTNPSGIDVVVVLCVPSACVSPCSTVPKGEAGIGVSDADGIFCPSCVPVGVTETNAPGTAAPVVS